MKVMNTEGAPGNGKKQLFKFEEAV